MRVALVTDGIWPYVLGGMQKHSYYLAKYLAQQKIYVDLYHYNNSQYDIQALEVFTDKERRFIQSVIVDMPRGMRFPGHYLYYSYKHSRLVFEAIRHKLDSYDFIYCKGFAGWYLIDQVKKGHLKSPPIGVKFHGYEMFQKPPDFRTRLQHLLILRRPVRNLSQKADIVFSYGGKITGIIESIGVAPEKIIELPSGVESATVVPEVGPAGAVKKILFLGRYERRKGIEELNSALRQLHSEHSDAGLQFTFVGPIPAGRQLKQSNVTYLGEIRNRQKLQEIIREQDILICPSWSEGMPNVILEAMAAGLAIIATDVGATNVLVDHENGWLLEDSSTGTIKRALKAASQVEENKLTAMKTASMQRIASQFTWELLIDRLVKKILPAAC